MILRNHGAYAAATTLAAAFLFAVVGMMPTEAVYGQVRPTPEPPVVVGLSAVLVGHNVKPLFQQCSRASPQKVDGYWNPTAEDLAALNAALPGYLANLKMRKPAQKSKALGYYRQCAGFTRGKHRLIYVNAISPTLKKELETDPVTQRKVRDWRRDPSVICDGGDITFGVEYDVEAKTFSEFQFNGPF